MIVAGRRFGGYLAVTCGLIRRYGASEPTVAHALLRLLSSCAAVAADDLERCAAIEEQARIVEHPLDLPCRGGGEHQPAVGGEEVGDRV